MRYWLFKSEPSTFSIDDLAKRVKQTEPWNGVRNYQARNFLRDEIKKGDEVLFYHSSCEPPGIVGTMHVVSDPYPDPTQFDPQSPYYDRGSTKDKPRWFLVDVKLIEKFPRLIPLAEIKKQNSLKSMVILRRGNRLSVTPVTKAEWLAVQKLVQ